MNLEWIGYAAAALTTCSFVPQAIKTIRSRDTRGLSLGMYVIFTIGVCMWFAYGVAIGSGPMIVANAVTFVLAVTVLGFKLRYG